MIIFSSFFYIFLSRIGLFGWKFKGVRKKRSAWYWEGKRGGRRRGDEIIIIRERKIQVWRKQLIKFECKTGKEGIFGGGGDLYAAS